MFRWFSLLVIAGTLTSPLLSGEHWPHWRGPNHNGTSSAVSIPTTWSQTESVLWRTPLPGPAPSTPVIWGDRIFLTSADGDDLVLMCLDTRGKTLWKRKIDNGNRDIRQGESNEAAPSPTTDGTHVWSFFGTGTLTAHDFEGVELWRRNMQKDYGTFGIYWGMAVSPLVDGDRLYLQLMHDGAQLVLALDKRSGKEIWRHERRSNARQESRHTYASPVMYRAQGNEWLLSHGSDYITAHNLADGAEVWRCGGLQKPDYNPFYRFVATPAVHGDLIVVPSAKGGPVLGLKPSGAKGDITDKNQFFAWKRSDQTPDVPSPLIHDGLVYLCRENGVLICMDAASGKEIYRKRTHDQRHRGSPVVAGNKILLTAMDGTISVIQTGREFKVLARNDMQEPMAASPAIAKETLFLRTHKALYAIGSK